MHSAVLSSQAVAAVAAVAGADSMWMEFEWDNKCDCCNGHH